MLQINLFEHQKDKQHELVVGPICVLHTHKVEKAFNVVLHLYQDENYTTHVWYDTNKKNLRGV